MRKAQWQERFLGGLKIILAGAAAPSAPIRRAAPHLRLPPLRGAPRNAPSPSQGGIGQDFLLDFIADDVGVAD